jgi:hypothetical protein
VLFLAAVGVCCAVTVKRMQGMDMGAGTDLGGLCWFAAVWVTMMVRGFAGLCGRFGNLPAG